jgi:hypothetical protein
VNGLCHIEVGVIRRSCRQTAVARLAYQACGSFVDAFSKRGDYTAFKPWHRGTTILLPPCAPREFANPAVLCRAITSAEHRRDSQEGRTIDFSLPRETPNGFELLYAAWILAPFVELGMAAQIDVERPPASDGGENPHAHATLALRELGTGGFGLKNRDWNQFFRDRDCKPIRTLIASRATAACALTGISAYMDPRTNIERGQAAPEERIPASQWRKWERRESCRVDDVVWSRDVMRAQDEDYPPPPLREDVYAQISCPLLQNLSLEDRRFALAEVARLAWEAGMVAKKRFYDNYDPNVLAWGSEDGALVMFDGENFDVFDFRTPQREASRLFRLINSLGWKAVVVDGDQDLVDEMAVLGAPVGLAPLNQAARPAALARIVDCGEDRLLRDVAKFDPLGSVAAAIATYRVDAKKNASAVASAALIDAPPQGETPAKSSEPAPVERAADRDFWIDDFPTYEPPKRTRIQLDAQEAEQARLLAINASRNQSTDTFLAWLQQRKSVPREDKWSTAALHNPADRKRDQDVEARLPDEDGANGPDPPGNPRGRA